MKGQVWKYTYTCTTKMLQSILHYTVTETAILIKNTFLISNYPYNVLKASNQNRLTYVHVPNIDL